MKIILFKDVPKVGRKNDVIEVSNGHARNFLFPQRLAGPATLKAIKELQKTINNKTAVSKKESEEFSKILKKISKEPILIKLPANEKGGLFQGAGAEFLAEEFKKRGLTVKKEEINLPEAIKQTGEHEVQITRGDVSENLKIIINPDKATENKK